MIATIKRWQSSSAEEEQMMKVIMNLILSINDIDEE